jgi:hypothetical protein
MGEKTKHRGRRAWLNPSSHHDRGWISVFVEEDMSWNHTISVTIGDCNRQVTLDLGFENEADRRQRLRKLDKIQGIIDYVRGELESLPPIKQGK